MTKRERLGRRLKAGWDEIMVRDAVLESNLSGTEKLVLFAIVSHADKRRIAGAERGLGVRRIALLASVNKDTPTAVVRRLEQHGLLRVLDDARPRHAPRFDLSELPAVLLRMLSEPKGQSVSEQRGQQEPDATTIDCPRKPDEAVPANRPEVSEQRGAKEPLKERSEGTILSPPVPAGSETGFALSSPEPERKPKRKRSGRGKKKTSKKKPEHTAEQLEAYKAVVATYCAGYEQRTGQKAIFDAEDGKHVWTLLGKVGFEGQRASAIVTKALRAEYGGSGSLRAIASDPKRFEALKLEKPTTRTSGPKQPNAGLWNLPVENL